MASPRLRVRIVGATAADLAELRRHLNDQHVTVVGERLIDGLDAGSDDADVVVMSPAVLARLAREGAPRPRVRLDPELPPVEALTPRERDVLALVADGLGNREVAEALAISEHTVKFHLASIFGKLGASSRTEAVQRGLRLGLIEI